MNKHVKILGYLYIAFSSLALAGCFLVYAIYAGSMTTLGILNEDSTLIAITGAIGALFFLIVLIPTLPGILAGYGLLKNKPWARVLTIIMGILYLMAVPVGTALGIYTLWGFILSGFYLMKKANLVLSNRKKIIISLYL